MKSKQVSNHNHRWNSKNTRYPFQEPQYLSYHHLPSSYYYYTSFASFTFSYRSYIPSEAYDIHFLPQAPRYWSGHVRATPQPAYRPPLIGKPRPHLKHITYKTFLTVITVLLWPTDITCGLAGYASWCLDGCWVGGWGRLVGQGKVRRGVGWES